MNSLEQNSQMLLKQLHLLSVDKLASLIDYHNENYFIKNEPQITDEAFDKLIETLRSKDPYHPSLMKIVGNSSQEIIHKYPMLSLDKCYDKESFLKWQKKIKGDIVALPKIDGIACSLIYDKNGKLITAATRGDGVKGENILSNVLMIKNVPQKIIIPNQVKELLEIRGEVFMPISIFQKYFAKDFSNPRNLAAGAIKLKDNIKSANYKLDFLAYDMIGDASLTISEKLASLAELGFSNIPFLMLNNDVNDIVNNFLQKQKEFDFETDGVVFKANLVSEQERLGVTSHHPKYAIAYKFQSDCAQTNLINIEWSLARSGVITPVAIFEPVNVAQANLSRASLHNLKQFYSYGFKDKSIIEVSRRGGVIPQVERVISATGESLTHPQFCPCCNGAVIIKDDFLYCENSDNCLLVKKSNIIYFCKVMNIEGLGSKIIEKLINANLINNLSDIYKLDLNKLLSIDRMGEKLALKILQEISNAKSVDLVTFLQSLGIKEIAENVSFLIANEFKTLERIMNLSLEDLNNLFGIGPKIAQNLIYGLSAKQEEIKELLKLIYIKPYQELYIKSNGPFYKKSVVFTGALSIDRRQAQKLVKEQGGVTPSSVSKNLNFLVIADDKKESSKQKEAYKLIKDGADIKIIDEHDFLRMINEN